MDKLQELMVALFVTVTSVFAFLAKRMFASVDNANKRIDKLEGKLVDRQFLESQIDPIRSDLNIILKHLLEKK
tara:strand:+ start:536 stop:754 length:219 start_codon:yes stop_codon:yes gene_type:complete